MRAVLLLVALAISAAQGRGLLQEGNVTGSILNGRDDPELGLFDKGRFPYIAQMRYPWADADGPGKGTFICAGTLIDPEFIVTSAWCAMNAGLLPEIRINSWLTNGPPGSFERRRSIAVAVHKQWPGQLTNRLAEDNIAVIRLNQPAKTKPIGAGAGLPPANPSPAVAIGTKMSIVGYGPIKSFADDLSPNLKGGSQLLLPQQRCHEKWSDTRRDGQALISPYTWPSMKAICAAYAGHNKALCKGDQGGPMVRRGNGPDGDMLVGIGVMTTCGRDGDRGGSVYANVPYYQGWIRSAMALLRRGARSQGDHRIVYTKDVVPNSGCGRPIGYPCQNHGDCCTYQCDAGTKLCWF